MQSVNPLMNSHKLFFIIIFLFSCRSFELKHSQKYTKNQKQL